MPRTRRVWFAIGAVAITLSITAFALLRDPSPEATLVPFSEFLGDLQADRVTSVVVDGDAVGFERTDGTRVTTVAPQGYIALNPTFVAGLVERGVRFDVSRAE
ncbi:MAG TPA: ATP-dependent metallopeptidase FtsH/Yme1/Tma family protein, partial [Vicinamibacterales bacterium]|nr:ATP-dependent metallopeptidase FtsH/Yme1/Tma family protein [Vicinamibacterales bacterium]